jgi:hypothetical protein
MTLENVSKLLLGNIGEDLPNSEFTDIQNLNNVKHNFPVFDILAKRDGETYVFSVKARKRFGRNGKINPCYNILYGSDTMSRKYQKALSYLTEMGYDIAKIHYCFLVAPLEEDKDCIYYWGELTEINPLATTDNILGNKISYLGVPVDDTHLNTYKVFGQREWEYIYTKYLKQK